MSTAPTDLYTISMDELRQRAIQEAAAEVVAEEVVPPVTAPEEEWSTEPVTPEGVTPNGEQPRDEKGRFVSQNPPKEGDLAPVEEYTATIDIGDGAGVQVFSAPSKDELLNKLIEAQENASRKIRELSTKKTVVETPTVKEPTPDEELELAQEFLANPHKAFDKLYRQRREEERQREEAAKAESQKQFEAAQAAAVAFVKSTPDFYPCDKNEKRIMKWLALNGDLAPTVENITTAYNDLNTDGLLVPKPAAEVKAAPRSSGLSVRRSAVPVTPVMSEAQTRDELYKIPLDQLRDALMVRR